jgi:DNA-binding GntR family transcriptional regulator
VSAERRAARLSTVDTLTEALRRRILDDELRPGMALREEQLSREYGVARHSLRSALRALQVEGLVQIEPTAAPGSPASAPRTFAAWPS